MPQGFNYPARRPLAQHDACANGSAPASAAPAASRSRVRTTSAYLLVPAGAQGPGFLMLQNFRAIMKYNPAEAYALAIGHLADRLRGGEPFVQAWPRHERVLTRAERLRDAAAARAAAASTSASRTAGSAPRPAPRCGTSRPRSGSSRTASPPPRSWSGCAR